MVQFSSCFDWFGTSGDGREGGDFSGGVVGEVFVVELLETLRAKTMFLTDARGGSGVEG
jgi:hypothetical protein